VILRNRVENFGGLELDLLLRPGETDLRNKGAAWESNITTRLGDIANNVSRSRCLRRGELIEETMNLRS